MNTKNQPAREMEKKLSPSPTNKALVSVIIPSYNHGQYITCAIDSVFQQTHKNWELIIVDDGSTDNTHEILQPYRKHPRIRVVLHHENRGQTVRLNQALDMARGEFISFLPSDDWYLPHKLEKQLALFAHLGPEYGVVYSQGLRYFESSKQTLPPRTNTMLKRGDILRDLLTGPFFVYPNTPLIRAACFQQYRFDESFFAEGEAIYFKIAMRWLFDYVDEPLTVMRDHNHNTGKLTERMLNDNYRYLQKLFAHPDFPAELQSLQDPVLAKLLKLKGWEMLRVHHNQAAARQLLSQAVRHDPRIILEIRVIIGLVFSCLPKVFVRHLPRRRKET